jgi:predicted nucleic acid-binding protein
MPGNFFDSNVPIYAAAGDDEKGSIAESLLARRGVISVQVLNEVAAVALRKLAFTLPEVIDVLDRLRAVAIVVPLTVETHETTLWVWKRHRFAFYDCAIVAAALLAECDTLWSEDMHDGLVIDGRLTIRNPFAT